MNRTLAFVIVAATASVLLSTATFAAASGGGGVPPDCPPAQEQEVSKEIGYTGETYHFNLAAENTSKLGMWRELNTWPGLQTEDGACNYFGEIRTYPADIYEGSADAFGLT